MRLRRLDLTRYGKFTDYSIDFGEHAAGTADLHIVYGLNEAGKSTALSGFLDLLFGIEERTRYGFIHQGKAMEIGACLEFDKQAHYFKRVKQRSNSLLNEQGQPLNEAILTVPLAGLTRDAYRMMFSLDDQTLEAGGNAILESKGDLGELLFSASAGLAGTSTNLEAAAAEADSIFRKRASSTQIAGLKRQIAELKSRREEIDTQASTYRTLAAALEQAQATYDAVMKEIGTAKARQDEIARILRAHPLAEEYQRGQAALAEYTNLPNPPDEWASTLPDVIALETRLQTQLASIERREQKLHEELEGLVVEERVLELTDRLDQITAAAARYTTAEEDLPKRRDALTGWTQKVDLILARLGQQHVDDPKTLLIPAATIGRLRDLIAEKSGIDVARQSTDKEHDSALQALESENRARRALDVQHAAAIDAGQAAQLQSVLRRLRDSDLATELRLTERAVSDKKRVFEDAVVGLQPWTGDGTALRQISPPRADRLEVWRSALNAIEKRRTQNVERERELATKKAQDSARIAALRELSNILDDEQAKAVLLKREEAWTEHMAVLDRESAERFEATMRQADAVVDARLHSAKELEEFRALIEGMAVNDASLKRQQQLQIEVDQELKALRREIRSETPLEVALNAEASTASWLSRIDQWTQRHTSALAAWDDLRQTQSEVDEGKAALAAEHASLDKALITIGLRTEGLGLPALMQAAETALADHAALQDKKTDSDKRLGECEAAADQRKAARDEATTAFEEWQLGWSGALSSTWFAHLHESVGAVRELLDSIGDLPEALREQDDLKHRIEAMESDRTDFVNAVKQLYDALGETPDGDNPLVAARAIIRRNSEAKQLAAKRQERDQALVDLAVEREQLDDEAIAHATGQKEMTEFFQAGSLLDVRTALERCRKRDELAAQQDNLARQIMADMQLQPLENAMASLADIDLTDLQSKQAELATRLEDLDGRAKNIFADKVRASDQLDAIGGDDAAARIEAARRTSLLKIEDLALRYLRLRSGCLIAEHGIRAYRDKHRSAMMNRASEAFGLITRGEYTGLATRPDKDRETLIGLSRHGASKLATEMSKGTQFQLYLALRLAGYEEFAAARPSVPFIADDIMETFDEPRSEEVFRLFGQMAQVGQVVYLTHHRHLCELVSAVVPSATIHEIT